MKDETRIPVLVGAGQVTQRETDPNVALGPMDLTAEACRQAAVDSGAGARLLQSPDTSWRFKSPFGGPKNPPKSIANRIGATNAGRLVYTHPGGNMPQWCITQLFQKVTRGEVEAALVCGGEALATQKAAERAKLALDWNEDAGGSYEEWGVAARGWDDIEDRHRMAGAIFAYPLFENGIRGHLKRTIPEHMAACGKLFAHFAAVAAKNPLADRRKGYSAEEIATVSADNPFIGFPYTKLMNSNAFIDQAAAVILTSAAKARQLGIPEKNWVHLHGTADAYDHWFISDRKNFHSSPAMRTVARETFEMAGMSLDDMDFIDLYSCFPSAVEIACMENGIALDDPRGLTVTGGLPYFGGPGNNYVTHSIAEMVSKVRSRPGSKGLVTANGNYVTKQSAGIYSTEPPQNPFKPKDPKTYQAAIDADKGPATVDAPEGKAVIETYTVMHDRKGPSYAILFARDAAGRRFIANTPEDQGLLRDMTERDYLGAGGAVTSRDGRNLFKPD
jgi:acetyl-CoA C-acetyltransferase